MTESAKRNPLRLSRRGATLVELVIAVGIAGLIAAGLHSAIFVSMRGLPNAQGSAQTTIQGSRILDRLVTELESAVFITEHTATALGFTVPDRNGDGIPERLRYAWTGSAGGPLTFQYNGGAPVTLVSRVNLFSITTKTQSVPETYPSLCVEDSTESTLADTFSSNSFVAQNVKSTEWYGQYYGITLPANAYAWRPTRLRILAVKTAVPASTAVQLRTVTASLTPTNAILDSAILDDSNLLASYSFRTLTYSQTDPIASGTGICCVLQHQVGSVSMAAHSNSGFPGMLKMTNSGGSGTTWTYDSTRALSTQLLGKLLRSTATQTVNSTYLLTVGLSLQIASAAPILQTTASALNHPELLSGLWEHKFDRNPTTTDVNGDGTGDWAVTSGGNFDTSSLSSDGWTTSGTSLQTSPGGDFAKATVVDLRMQNSTVGGQGATFSINALRSGSTCAPILLRLALQSDGTQTLALLKRTNDSTTQSLVTVSPIAGGAVDVHLVIDPTASSVSLKVNGVQRGTYGVTRYASSDSSRVATIGAQGSTAKFSYARVRVVE